MKTPPIPPRGYDNYCKQCRQPYTFENAKVVNTKLWQHYCSPGCQKGTVFRKS